MVDLYDNILLLQSLVLLYMHPAFQLLLNVVGFLLGCGLLSAQCGMLVLVGFQCLWIHLHIPFRMYSLVVGRLCSLPLTVTVALSCSLWRLTCTFCGFIAIFLFKFMLEEIALMVSWISCRVSLSMTLLLLGTDFALVCLGLVLLWFWGWSSVYGVCFSLHCFNVHLCVLLNLGGWLDVWVVYISHCLCKYPSHEKAVICVCHLA